MRPPSLREIAVAAGFLAVSLIVASTANAMVSPPDRTPVASAVELHQPDPESLTPPIEAADASVEPVAEPAPPVEVAAAAIECSDAGVCDGSRAADPLASAPITSGVHETPSPPDAAPACVRPDPPAPLAEGADREAWGQAIEAWAEQWREWAKDCGWDPEAWRAELREAGLFDGVGLPDIEVGQLEQWRHDGSKPEGEGDRGDRDDHDDHDDHGTWPGHEYGQDRERAEAPDGWDGWDRDGVQYGDGRERGQRDR